MRYVVCYDIGDDRRRTRMVRVLKDFGERVQESVFVAELEEGQAVEMVGRAEKELNEGGRLHVFVMCAGCEKKMVVRGQAWMPEEPEYYLI